MSVIALCTAAKTSVRPESRMTAEKMELTLSMTYCTSVHKDLLNQKWNKRSIMRSNKLGINEGYGYQ